MARTRGDVRPTVVASLLMALLLGACTGVPPVQPSSPAAVATPVAGGIFRTEIQDFGLTDGFDPVGESSTLALGLYSQLLLRTLVTYRHVAGVAGTKVVPDLATDTGQVSSDGLTWTFTLKQRLWWAPPVYRSITSGDVAYAFRRIDTASLKPRYGAGFGGWFDGLIVGMDGSRATAPSQIAGIQTQDDRTIVFHLRHPAGDFPDRLALPAAAPVPQEVAGCYKHAGWYGRTLVASGPYMIEGEGTLGTASCSQLSSPEGGFDPTRHLRLVRNPNYRPSTDSPQDRSNFLDGIDILVETNPARILHDASTGWIDGLVSDPYTVGRIPAVPPGGLRLRSFAGSGGLQYLFMNLLDQPFDDVHVRRAVEYAIDRSHLLAVGGGPISRQPATHLFRSPVLSTDPNFDPYPHSLTAARAEMARSRYDHNHDGTCDDPVCRNLLFLPCSVPRPSTYMLSPLQSELASIGVLVKIRELDGNFICSQASETPRNMLAIGFAPGWTPDFPDPVGLADRLSSAGIACVLQTNVSEVGMTRAQMRGCRMPPDISLPPSVDTDVARCEVLTNDARNVCWDAFDHHVMEDIVPWVPLYWTSNTVLVTGPTVVPQTVTMDQFSGMISLCHLAVFNHATMPI